MGSVNPRNSLQATFFREYQELPETETRPLLDVRGNQGRLGDVEATPSDTIKFTRELEVTLVFTRQGVADLIPWLREKLKEMDQRQTQPDGVQTDE